MSFIHKLLYFISDKPDPVYETKVAGGQFINDFKRVYYDAWDCPVRDDEILCQINCGYCVNFCLAIVEHLTRKNIKFQIYRNKEETHWVISVDDNGTPRYFDAWAYTGTIDSYFFYEDGPYDLTPVNVNDLLIIDQFQFRWNKWLVDKKRGKGFYISVPRMNMLSEANPTLTDAELETPTERDFALMEYVAVSRRKQLFNKFSPFNLTKLL